MAWNFAPFNVNDGTIKMQNLKIKLVGQKLVADHIEKVWPDEDIVAITPAMIHGSAMDNIFKHYPKRSFDVGIAEEHALTFTAGLAVLK